MFVSQLFVVKADHLVPHHSADGSYRIFPTVGFPSNSNISSIQVNLFTEQLMQHGSSSTSGGYCRSGSMPSVDRICQFGTPSEMKQASTAVLILLMSLRLILETWLRVSPSAHQHSGLSLACGESSGCLVSYTGSKTKTGALVLQPLWMLSMTMPLKKSSMCRFVVPPYAKSTMTKSKQLVRWQIEDEHKWADWEPAFTNYLSTIPGVYGIPLSFVICENDNPQHNQDFGEDFTQEMISCASLRGANFHADSQKVHQLLKTYLVAESAEQWIRDIEHLING